MISNTTLMNLYSEAERDLDSYILINGTTKLSAKDYLQDVKLNQKADKDGQWVGQAIPKKLDCTIIKKDLEVTIKEGDKVELFHGIKGVDDTYIYQKLGLYYIQSIENKEDSETLRFTAYDKLKTFQVKEIGQISYPITVGQLLALATQGHTVDSINVLAKDYTIENEIYLGQVPKVIDVLIAIAQMSLCFVYVDVNDKIIFKRLDDTSHEIQLANVFKLKFKGKQKPYNSVVISRMPQEDNVFFQDEQAIASDGLSELKIANNPIMDTNREYFAQLLLPTAKTITYDGISHLSMQSNPLFEAGDLVTIEGKSIAILEHELTLTRSNILSEIADISTIDYSKAKGLEEAVRNTELYVDKVAGEIKASISTNVDERLTELRMTEEGITQRVSSTVTAFVQENEELLKGESGADFHWNLIKDGHFNLASSYVPANQIFLVYRNSFSAKDSILAMTSSEKNTTQRLERRIRIEEKGTYTYTFRMKVSSAISHVGEWKMLVNASAPATTQDIPASEWMTYHITFTVDRDATDAYADKLLRFYIPTLEVGATVEIDWEKLVKSDKATSEFVPNETEIHGKDGKDGLPGPKGEDGKDAAILSATAPADKDQLWFDLNTNEMKYWDVKQQDWMEVTWELEGRVSAAEQKITDDAIVSTVTKSESWITLNNKADAGQTESQVKQLINNFSAQTLTDTYIMNKVSNTTTWKNLLSNVNKKVDSSQVSTQITNWASQELTADKLMSKISSSTTWTDQAGKITELESKTSTVEQTLNDFRIEFNQSSGTNLLMATFGFRPFPSLVFVGDGSYSWAEETGNLKLINDKGFYGDATRVGYPLAKEVALNGQYFTLSLNIKSDYSTATRFRFRLPGESTWKYVDVNTSYFKAQSVLWKTNVTSGAKVRDIYLQVMRPDKASGTTTAQAVIQGQSFKLEESKIATPWTRAESEMIRSTAYTFDESGVRFTYDGQDKLVFDGMTGNLDITGRIHATGGTIGAWDIYADGRLIGEKNGVKLTLDPRGLYNPLQYNVGGTNYFSLNKDGSMYSRSASGSFAGSGSFTSGSFAGNHSGYGNFTSGSYTGSMYSGYGTIGGQSFSTGPDRANLGTISAYLYTSGIALGNSYISGTTSSGNSVSCRLEGGSWFFTNSDIRLKENIEELTGEYNEYIYNMPLIKYTYKADADHNPQVGVNANYLMKTLPEYMAKSFLHQDKITGLYGANYELIVPYLIKTIQDLNERLKKVEGN